MLRFIAASALFAFAALYVCSEPARAERTVTITAKNFSFSPAVVTLKKGEAVSLHLKASEGVHGLNVPALGINNATLNSEGTVVKIAPKKAGTFVAHCSIVCGAGHPNMAMKFIVK